MKALILKGILFIILLYIPLYFIQKVVDAGMRKYRNGEYGVWNDIYDGKINADIIIVGNSRAFVNISPLILDSALHQSAYDLGVDGGDFNMAYTRFEVYLAHNKVPKTVILSISTSDFEKSGGMFFPQQFMPYLADTILRNNLKGYENSYTKADYYIPAMKYRTDPQSYLIGLKLYLGQYVVNDDPRVEGYQARPRKWDDSFLKFKKSGKTYTIKADTTLLKEFYKMIGICHKDNIKLYFVYTPEYVNIQPFFLNRDKIFGYYEDAARINKIPFLDYSNDAISHDTTNFYNSEHLNQHGSEVFTRKLAEDMLNPAIDLGKK